MSTSPSPLQFRNPEVSAAKAQRLARARWGVEGEVSDVGSLQDLNFRLAAAEGGAFVLKIANQETRRETLEMEHAALRHLRGRLEGIAIPEPVPALDGETIVATDGYLVRLMTWLPGVPMASLGHLDDSLLHGLGALAGACGRGLEGFRHPAADRFSEWDSRQAATVVAELPRLQGEERLAVERALAPLRDLGEPLAAALPRQVIHSDITDANTVGRQVEGGFRPTALIDFGDLVETWRLCDPAAAAVAAIVRNVDDPLGTALAVLGGYRSEVEPTDAEVEAFWPVLLARAAICAALSTEQLRESPGNEYAATTSAGDWRALEAVLAVPVPLARAAVRRACGREPVAGQAGLGARLVAAGPALPLAGLDRADLMPIDLGVASERLFDGNWESAPGLAEAVRVDGVGVGRWGEVRLPAATRVGAEEPPTLHLGVDLFVAAGTGVVAPLDGRVVVWAEDELTLGCPLAGESLYLRLAGIEPSVGRGDAVRRGEHVGAVAATGVPHLHLQLATAPGLPGMGRPREREAWLALCPDPSPLLGIDATAPAPPRAGDQRERRRAVVASAQPLYYRAPVEWVRGWRQYLYDSDGRPYLDVVNNVASIGHSHPWVTEAAQHQFRLLNTNSRFLYDAMTEYAERVSALLPAALDTVVVVNSGSEALDLAVQLARAYTGREDLAAIAGAYHGWTDAVYEACTSPQDNPGWRASIPPRIHVVEQPDPFRGAHGDDAAAYVASVRDACTAAAGRGGLAAFLSEALLGNQGAVVPPAGYLAAAYDVVRAAGGVCIADEVQVGYARTGSSFWAFEHEGVVPDVVAAAKATGNGHPIGFVVCRREIAEALARRASFFSSTGGGPVSCRVGLAVLDAIRDEGLQENAARVGTELKRRLAGLAADHALIGSVNGRGLYLGVDLVADRETREPAPAAAAAVCERLRELGIVVQPTGDAYNVLKLKPPMCIGDEDVDRFLTALRRALTEVEAQLL